MTKNASTRAAASAIRPESQQSGKPGKTAGAAKTATKGTSGREANERDGNANAEGKGAAKSRQSRK